MKYFIIISILVVFSCSEHKSEVGSKNITIIIDSKENDLSQNDVIKKVKVIPKFDFADSTFESFYVQFKIDSAFQRNRIKFPIKGKYQSYDEERVWTLENWPLMKWDFRSEINNPDDSVSIIQDNNMFFFGTYCLECGFSFEMQFDKIDNKWFLTYRQENNY